MRQVERDLRARWQNQSGLGRTNYHRAIRSLDFRSCSEDAPRANPRT